MKRVSILDPSLRYVPLGLTNGFAVVLILANLIVLGRPVNAHEIEASAPRVSVLDGRREQAPVPRELLKDYVSTHIRHKITYLGTVPGPQSQGRSVHEPSPPLLPETPASRRGARRPPASAPLYRQIRHLLLESLRRGEWAPGAAIPSETELAARFQVSQGTVRRAIDELVSEHLLVRRQGKGTFVATHHEPRAQYRFLRLAPDRGEPPGTRSRFLQCERVRAETEIAARLGLRTGAALVHVRRVLLFGDVPRVLDDIWLPAGPFRNLSADRLAQYKGPLYGLFESEFGMRMIRAEEQLRAVAAAAEDAAPLQVEAGSPLLRVDRVSYTYGDRAIEFRRGHCVTTDFHYRNTLT